MGACLSTEAPPPQPAERIEARPHANGGGQSTGGDRAGPRPSGDAAPAAPFAVVEPQPPVAKEGAVADPVRAAPRPGRRGRRRGGPRRGVIHAARRAAALRCCAAAAAPRPHLTPPRGARPPPPPFPPPPAQPAKPFAAGARISGLLSELNLLTENAALAMPETAELLVAQLPGVDFCRWRGGRARRGAAWRKRMAHGAWRMPQAACAARMAHAAGVACSGLDSAPDPPLAHATRAPQHHVHGPQQPCDRAAQQRRRRRGGPQPRACDAAQQRAEHRRRAARRRRRRRERVCARAGAAQRGEPRAPRVPHGRAAARALRDGGAGAWGEGARGLPGLAGRPAAACLRAAALAPACGAAHSRPPCARQAAGEDLPQCFRTLHSCALESFYALPIKAGPRVVGVLTVGSRRAGTFDDAGLQLLLTAAASSLTTHLRNQRVRRERAHLHEGCCWSVLPCGAADAAAQRCWQMQPLPRPGSRAPFPSCCFCAASSPRPTRTTTLSRRSACWCTACRRSCGARPTWSSRSASACWTPSARRCC
jgi:hypothetical protein